MAHTCSSYLKTCCKTAKWFFQGNWWQDIKCLRELKSIRLYKVKIIEFEDAMNKIQISE